MTYGPRRAPGVSGIATAILHAYDEVRSGIDRSASNDRRFDRNLTAGGSVLEQPTRVLAEKP
jgi:hypothetical protein